MLNVDDVVLSGPLHQLDEHSEDLKRNLAVHGLRLEDGKCKLWDPVRTYVPAHPKVRDLWNQQLTGLAICGSCLAPDSDEELPLGRDAFRSQWFQNKATQLMSLCGIIDALPRLADASQLCNLLASC